MSDPASRDENRPAHRYGVAHATVLDDRFVLENAGGSFPISAATTWRFMGAPREWFLMRQIAQQLRQYLSTGLAATHVTCVDAPGHHTKADVTGCAQAWSRPEAPRNAASERSDEAFAPVTFRPPH